MGLRISGAGCSLIDYLYTNIDFSEHTLQRYFSRIPGDGGITPGKLVFADEFEQFCGTGFLQAIEEIDRKSTRLNSSHTDISRMPSSS